MGSYEDNAKVFKSLCDPNRLMIMQMLQSGEKCACRILEELDIVQSTLSHHMKILCESGLVSARRNGKWMHYSLDAHACLEAQKLLVKLTSIKANAEVSECR